MQKALVEDGLEWLYIIINKFLQQERLSGDIEESEIVTICKQKGDVMQYGNYRSIKLMEIALKIYERVNDSFIREKVHNQYNQLVSCLAKVQQMPFIF